ncbi:hypothetical protein L1987_57595 [Smallanthus sonchifolius]|uniref:Uncharacterized protein n=1 Tax=Smallanthus sonchifolius TaxID=185202 RepID=A0ACB9DD83_9ASTR|nr:hypothetical protein L1987_57595 [Smallanthus sonchifolius]
MCLDTLNCHQNVSIPKYDLRRGTSTATSCGSKLYDADLEVLYYNTVRSGTGDEAKLESKLFMRVVSRALKIRIEVKAVEKSESKGLQPLPNTLLVISSSRLTAVAGSFRHLNPSYQFPDLIFGKLICVESYNLFSIS